MTTEEIARVCHEANRAYCKGLGDSSQLPWDEAPEWQRRSAVAGVVHALSNPAAPPSASHESWLEEKRRDGWKYGPVKDPARKEHPCFVPYEQLPPDQRRKDALFLAVVRSLSLEAQVSDAGRVDLACLKAFGAAADPMLREACPPGAFFALIAFDAKEGFPVHFYLDTNSPPGLHLARALTKASALASDG